MNKGFRGRSKSKNAVNQFSGIKIGLASPDQIRSWSYGEVTKPETINYRTFKPEKDGLFCAKIFGPTNDYECLCGKFKRMKHRGVICDKCGVEVTKSEVRRERMGHIELAAPVSHIWYFKGLPSRLGHLLGMKLRDLERVLYFEAYIVTEPADTPLEEKQVLSEDEYKEARDEYGMEFEAGMGAESVKKILERIDIEERALKLRHKMKTETSKQKRKKASKRLKVVEAILESDNKPEWMIMEVIPVIPPELRPLVPLDGGRFATSDLNDLYRKVITRNNRLKKLLELSAPKVIIRNEKRMLQEAVDALFDNGRRGRAFRGSNNRPLKSLADTLKGKQGRFRQNLLGKRVDYSGRSVIVVGPELKMHQCGLPKKMALELFKPFIFNKLEQAGYAATIKAAKKMVDNKHPKVWDFLDEVIKDHSVLLNRAPTLHRLGIQAFEPVLVEGKAIRIHPLVCTAFNADFDGDQMAVHVPLSPEAQAEAKVLMRSTKNLLSPATGKALAIPSQDIILGLYYMTLALPDRKGEGWVFSDPNEVRRAYESGKVEINTPIRLQYTGELIDLTSSEGQNILQRDIQIVERQPLSTTVGRVLLNDRLPDKLPFINGLLKEEGLSQLVNFCSLRFGNEMTVEMLEELKDLGFYHSTKAGLSFGVDDMIIPEDKQELIDKAQAEVDETEQLYLDGEITEGERYNKIVDIWTRVRDDISSEMFDIMSKPDSETGVNPIYAMADSGSRGSEQQIRQLAGMRGLMAKPSGEIIETPITANFREGLDALQYFISTHGARKGLADTALKTADSGYLTRRLVDVVQDVVIVEDDCNTLSGIEVSAITDGGEIIEPLRDRIIGRVALEDVIDPVSGDILVEADETIDNDTANRIEEYGIDTVMVRSVLSCESRDGICAKCYGWDLAHGEMVSVGTAAGIIAAQSIGEPGTQLTMRTFHIGGTASQTVEETVHTSKFGGIVEFKDLSTVKDQEGNLAVMNRNGRLVIKDEEGREKEDYDVVYGARIKVEDGEEVEKGAELIEWDPFSMYILTEYGGTVEFREMIKEVTVKEEVDERTGHSRLLVMEDPDPSKEPRIIIKDENGEEVHSYLMPSTANIEVNENEEVHPGDVLAKIPRETTKTKDITGGLPRVESLFEARSPKDPAVITEIDGVVKYGETTKSSRRLFVENESGERKRYLIPKGTHILVRDGEEVDVGDPLVDGPIDPHDILRVLGETELQNYLLNQIQEVYRSQGVNLHDKHIEVVVRQMMKWVIVEEVGDTDFLVNEKVDKFKFREENKKIIAEDGEPATGRPMLLGITKASLNTDSFISAASFQETTRVLTEASIEGKVDNLEGLKENVIMGRLIPAGTGRQENRKFEFDVEQSKQMKEEEQVREIRQRMLGDREKD